MINKPQQDCVRTPYALATRHVCGPPSPTHLDSDAATDTACTPASCRPSAANTHQMLQSAGQCMSEF